MPKTHPDTRMHHRMVAAVAGHWWIVARDLDASVRVDVDECTAGELRMVE